MTIYLRYFYLLLFFISAGLLLGGKFTYSMILLGIALSIHIVDIVKICLKTLDDEDIRDDCCCKEEK